MFRPKAEQYAVCYRRRQPLPGGHYRGRRGLAFGYHRPKASGSKDRRSETGEDSGPARRSTRSTGAELIPFFFLSLAHGSSVYSPTGSVQRVDRAVLARSKSSSRAGQVRSGYPKGMKREPGRVHGAGPRSGRGVGCRRCSRSRKPRGLSLHAQTRRRSISLTHPPTCFAQEYRQATWRWQRKGDTPKVPQGQESLATRRRKR